MMLKDLGLAADAAASVGAPLHTGKAAVDLFTAMVDSGCVFGEAVVAAAGVAVSVHGLITRGAMCRLGGKDFSSAYKFVKDASTDKN